MSCVHVLYIGEYYIAELIESQDVNHKTLVAEVSDTAAVYISTSVIVVCVGQW